MCAEGKANDVVDVDGSYLHKKHKALVEAGKEVSSLSKPLPPLCGWMAITQENFKTMADKIPLITSGIRPTLY